jgi:flagellar biosynthesis chaperone FliJ
MDKIRATRAWRELDETAEQQKMDDAARVDAIINSEY